MEVQKRVYVYVLSRGEGKDVEEQKDVIVQYTKKRFPRHETHFCEEKFAEGVKIRFTERKELQQILQNLTEGDVVAVKSLSKLSRKLTEIQLVQTGIVDKGAYLCIVDIQIDTSKPAGMFFQQICSAVIEDKNEVDGEAEIINVAMTKKEYKEHQAYLKRKMDED